MIAGSSFLNGMMMNKSSKAIGTTTIVLAVLTSVGFGQQSVEERLKALEAQQKQLQSELRASHARNESLELEIMDLRSENQQIRETESTEQLAMAVNVLTAELEESNWHNATKSGSPIRFYGFFRLDTYYQTGRSSSVIVPTTIAPEGGPIDDHDDDFAFDARLTRFGFEIDAGRIGDADVMAKLETDFANFPSGPPESRPTPRIRLAYVNMDFGNVTLRMGQDWDVISPLYPAVNSETLMWNTGNLGDRRPQAQVRLLTGAPEEAQFSLILSAGLTGAVNNQDLDAGTPFSERDGFDAGHPHLQGRAGVSFNSWVDGKRAGLGVWGAFGRLETDIPIAGDDHFTSWVVGLDLELPLLDRLTLRGEAWFGEALGDFRGTIGQAINTTSGDEIGGWGGFAEIVWQVTDEFRLSFGGSMDNVDDGDLSSGGRDLNWAVWVGSVYQFASQFKAGLDVIFWETQYLDSGLGNLVRINFYTQLNF